MRTAWPWRANRGPRSYLDAHRLGLVKSTMYISPAASTARHAGVGRQARARKGSENSARGPAAREKGQSDMPRGDCLRITFRHATSWAREKSYAHLAC